MSFSSRCFTVLLLLVNLINIECVSRDDAKNKYLSLSAKISTVNVFNSQYDILGSDQEDEDTETSSDSEVECYSTNPKTMNKAW
jgi:hypothetical protein